MLTRSFFVFILFSAPFLLRAQQLYFPPLNANATWETTTPQSLGWCTENIDSLYQFLDENNTKAFLVLKDGKIVLEKYFDTFTKDSNWYWASAGKSLTSLLVGKAKEEGYLSLDDSSSKYLGSGWTNCTAEQEGKITIWNQITMTSGLDDGVANNHCTTPSCLVYKAVAGTRWAYHNAPYTLLDNVISTATGQTLNAYTQAKVKTQTGINGLWVKVDDDNVYFSTPRSLARYALLAQNNFIWNTDTLLHDTVYKNQMVNSSQLLNKSYGYLWWLNGKTSYMVPTSQLVIPGSYAPNAPADMFAAIGKNGQIASISKSNGLIVIRMGDEPGTGIEVPTQFCDKIWLNLNKVICTPHTALAEKAEPLSFSIFPNPVTSTVTLNLESHEPCEVTVYNSIGINILMQKDIHPIDMSHWDAGMYIIEVSSGGNIYRTRVIKQ